MASRQGAVKHGFVSKIAGGCSSYDVIAPLPDLTWSLFYQKLCKVFPITYLKNPAALRAAVFSLSAKTSGGLHQPSPVRARVKWHSLLFQVETALEYLMILLLLLPTTVHTLK